MAIAPLGRQRLTVLGGGVGLLAVDGLVTEWFYRACLRDNKSHKLEAPRPILEHLDLVKNLVAKKPHGVDLGAVLEGSYLAEQELNRQCAPTGELQVNTFFKVMASDLAERAGESKDSELGRMHIWVIAGLNQPPD